MDPNIILGGHGVNALGAIADANQAAGQQKAYQAANALAPVVQAQQEANLRQTNALAPYDVPLAQAELAFKQQQLQTLKQQAMTQAAEQASRMTAQQIAAERDQQTRLLKGAAVFYAKKDRAGYDQFLKLNGVDPAQFPFDHFETVAAMADGVLEVYDRFAPKQPEWQPAPPEVAQQYGAVAGQVNTQTGKFDPINPPSGMSITTGPNGTTIMQGPGAAKAAPAVPVKDPQFMIDTIDGILNDPAGPASTGVFAFLQNVPGTPMKRFQGRAAQIEAQAFMQGFEALKGAGAITELEGSRALAAVGRLDSAQSWKDYTDALKELRGVLVLGQQRLSGGQGLPIAEQPQQAQPAPQQPNMAQPQDGPQPGVTEDGYRFLGGDPGDPNNWEKVK